MERETVDIDELLLELKSTLNSQKILAVKKLGELRNKIATEPLLELLGNKHKPLRVAVIRALGSINDPKSIPHLLDQRRDPSPDIRYGVAQALATLPAKDPVIEALKELAKDSHAEVAVQALGALIRHPQRAIGFLIELFDHPRWHIRQSVAEIIAPAALEVLPQLKIALEHERPNIRYWVCVVLGNIRIPELAPLLLKRLQDRDEGVRVGAVAALSKIRDASLIPLLLESLSTFSTSANEGAATVLVHYGRELLPHLIKLLGSDSYSQRAFASELIIKMPDKSVEDLVQSIHQGNLNQVFWILKILGEIRDSRTLPLLLKFLDVAQLDLQLSAITALGNFRSQEVLPRLIELFSHKEWIVRHTASQAILQYRGQAIAPLIADLRNRKRDNRYWSARTLGEIGDTNALPAVESLLTDREWSVRLASATALLKFGDPGKLVLMKLAHSDEIEKKYWAIKTLAKLGAPDTMEIFIQAISHNAETIRNAAGDGLSAIGPSVIVPLINLFKSHRRSTCLKIMDIIVAFGEEAQKILLKYLGKCDDETNYWLGQCLKKLPMDSLGEIIALTTHKSFDVRLRAVQILGQFAPGGETLKVLLPLLRDEFWPMRIAATRTLGAGRYVEAVEEILRHLDDENTELAMVSAEALGKIGDPRAVNPLLHSLGHESSLFRKEAIRALGLLGEPKITPRLEQMFNTLEEDLQFEVLSAINQLNSPLTFKLVETLVKNPQRFSFALRHQATLNLVYHPAKFVAPLLKILILKHQPWQIRLSALETIETLKINELSKDIFALVSDDDYLIREKAGQLLKDILPPDELAKIRGQMAQKQELARKIAESSRAGIELLKEKRYAEAIPHFQKAHDLNPDNNTIKAYYGTVLFNGGQVLKATEIFESLVKSDPANMSHQLNLAGLYIKRKFIKEAEGVLRKILEIASPQENYAQLAQKMLQTIKPDPLPGKSLAKGTK